MSQLRMNVRNFLVGLTPSEIRTVLDAAVREGDEVRAGYISEYLDEVLEECAEYGDGSDCDCNHVCERCDGSDCYDDSGVFPVSYF